MSRKRKCLLLLNVIIGSNLSDNIGSDYCMVFSEWGGNKVAVCPKMKASAKYMLSFVFFFLKLSNIKVASANYFLIFTTMTTFLST